MALWLPLLKASLPYVTQIVASAIPAFTSKPDATNRPASTSRPEDDVTAKQIVELQSAVTQNAESIHVLAEKLQLTIQGIEQAGNSFQKEMLYFKRLAFISLGVAALSLVLAGFSLLQ